MPSNTTKPIKNKGETFAKAVVEYYITVGNYSKNKTVHHFRKNTKDKNGSVQVYRAIQRYERRGISGFAKKTGRKRKIIPVEKKRKLKQLMEKDPSITNNEAAEFLQVSLDTLKKLKKSLLNIDKEGAETARTAITGKQNDNQKNLVNEAETAGTGYVFNDYNGDGEPYESDGMRGDQITVNPIKCKAKAAGRNFSRKVDKRVLCGPKQYCIACLEKFHGNPDEIRKTKLEENLDSFFVLRKVLQIPYEDIVSFLGKSNGYGPSYWARFCEACWGVVKEALLIQREILKLEVRMVECRKKIEETVKRNVPSRRVRQVPKRIMMLRQVIEKRTLEIPPPTPTNPFLEGDRRAKSICKALKPLHHDIVVKEEVQVPESPEEIFEEEETLTQPEHSVFSEVSVVVKNDLTVPMKTSVDSLPSSPSPPDVKTGPHIEMTDFQGSNETVSPEVLTSTNPHSHNITSSRDSDEILSSPVTPTPSTPSPELCDLCGTHIRLAALPLHKLREHGVVMDGFTARRCTETDCNYVTLYATSLQLHLAAHEASVSGRYSCQFCGKSLPTSFSLKCHEEIHKNAETKPYQCDTCGSSFAVSTYLYVHKRRTSCGRSFSSAKRKRTKLT